jgi:hypothetical protein
MLRQKCSFFFFRNAFNLISVLRTTILQAVPNVILGLLFFLSLNTLRYYIVQGILLILLSDLLKKDNNECATL